MAAAAASKVAPTSGNKMLECSCAPGDDKEGGTEREEKQFEHGLLAGRCLDMFEILASTVRNRFRKALTSPNELLIDVLRRSFVRAKQISAGCAVA